MFRFLTVSALMLLVSFGTVHAQEQSRSILVLDASGSMWGQIDGVTKIEIAREVVGDLLADFPAENELGLTVYGHRRKGDCSDIETLIAPGTGQAQTIAEAVNGISPRGKTPMTAAVVAAAEALKFTEERATVILVSDGIETCEPDPCAIARTLEQTGVDFTAHVVGFDVSDPEALAQMQCLADETGGTFRTASNAEELTEALAVVAEPEPAPEPELTEVTLRAVLDGEAGPPVEGRIEWTVTGPDGSVVEDMAGNPLMLELEEGSYVARGDWLEAEQTAERQFIATGAVRDVPVVFEMPAPAATLTAPAEAVAGSAIEVAWTGPENENDYIGIGLVDSTHHHQWQNYTDISEGSPLTLITPPVPGEYLIQYFLRSNREPIAATAITLTPPPVSITAPAEAVAGSTIELAWVGPDYEEDFIGIGPADADNHERWMNYTETSQGSPLELLIPPTPGDYVIRYFAREDYTVLTEVAIKVTEAPASLTAPAEAAAGSTVEIAWTGPDYKDDYIGIGPADSENHERWMNYTYTKEGSPLELQMPAEPGGYVIRYFAAQDRTPLAEVAITLTEIGASITAPTQAVAGSEIEIAWTGPDYKDDYIGIGPADSENHERWMNYTYTKEGSPLDLLVPPEPGEYIIRYFAAQDRTPLAEASITVTGLNATVTAPTEAAAGSEIEVSWTGPGYDDDFIGIGPADAENHERWMNYSYTRNGERLKLEMPTEPGDYMIRYIVGQGRGSIAEQAISVTPVTATITAPDKAAAGSEIEISWTGPDYDGDYVGIGKADATGGQRWEQYSYTRNGSPMSLKLPEEPGAYVIRYFINQDRTEVVSTPIILE